MISSTESLILKLKNDKENTDHHHHHIGNTMSFDEMRCKSMIQ